MLSHRVEVLSLSCVAISEFGKTAGYKVNIQKWKAFLYTNNEISEIEIGKKSHLLQQKEK